MDDVELFNAAKKAIYIIVEKHGVKADTLRNVARKHKVNESELKECIEIAIPSIFFALRSQKAKKRYEDSFYKAPEVQFIADSEKKSGFDSIKKIKEMLKK